MTADAYVDTRPHPVQGMVANPEWEATRNRREQAYLDRRAALYAKPRRGLLLGMVALYWSGVR